MLQTSKNQSNKCCPIPEKKDFTVFKNENTNSLVQENITFVITSKNSIYYGYKENLKMLTLSLENLKKLSKQFCSRTQKFWPDLLLHMATKQDRDSSPLKTDALPSKSRTLSQILPTSHVLKPLIWEKTKKKIE